MRCRIDTRLPLELAGECRGVDEPETSALVIEVPLDVIELESDLRFARLAHENGVESILTTESERCRVIHVVEDGWCFRDLRARLPPPAEQLTMGPHRHEDAAGIDVVLPFADVVPQVQHVMPLVEASKWIDGIREHDERPTTFSLLKERVQR